jgi:hypothetical protein
MMDFLIGGEQYPVDAEYLQKNKPLTVDEAVSYEGAIPFNYRFVKKDNFAQQDVNGLKMNKYVFVIRTKDNLPFTKGDIIRVAEKVYKIESAIQTDNTLYEKARIIYQHFNDYETEITMV